MIGHKINDQPEMTAMGLFKESLKCFQVAEDRVYIAVIRNVIAKIGHGRGKKRGNPDGIHPKPGQVVKLSNDALQIPDAITIAIFETSWVNLVNHARLPPMQPNTSLFPNHCVCSPFLVTDVGGC